MRETNLNKKLLLTSVLTSAKGSLYYTSGSTNVGVPNVSESSLFGFSYGEYALGDARNMTAYFETMYSNRPFTQADERSTGFQVTAQEINFSLDVDVNHSLERCRYSDR